MSLLINEYSMYLNSKYSNVVRNNWIWVFAALVFMVGLFAYAFYCTSKGYAFAGHVRYHIPSFGRMGIACRPR